MVASGATVAPLVPLRQVCSSRGEDLVVTFQDDDEIADVTQGWGYELAATRAALRSRIKDGQLTVEATLRVDAHTSKRLKTVE